MFEEPGGVVMHSIDHLQLTNGEADTDAVLALASELADAHGVDLVSYLLVHGILAVADEYSYLRMKEREVQAYESNRIDALIAEQHGLAAD